MCMVSGGLQWRAAGLGLQDARVAWVVLHKQEMHGASQCSSAQLSTAEHSTGWHTMCMVSRSQCQDAGWHQDTIQRITAEHDTAHSSTEQRSRAQTQHNALQHRTAQYSAGHVLDNTGYTSATMCQGHLAKQPLWTMPSCKHRLDTCARCCPAGCQPATRQWAATCLTPASCSCLQYLFRQLQLWCLVHQSSSISKAAAAQKVAWAPARVLARLACALLTLPRSTVAWQRSTTS